MFKWLKSNKKEEKLETTTPPPSQVYQIEPVQPFGYKSVWLAVLSDSAVEAAEAIKTLGYTNFQVNESFEGWVFVHEVMDSVTDFAKVTAINEQAEDAYSYWTLLKESDCTDKKNLDVLTELSKSFGTICFFVNHRIADCYAWVKCENGEILRAFEFIEGYGVTVDLGLPTEEEDDLVINYGDFNSQNELDEEEIDTPSEEDVIEIAEAWSCLPS